MPIAGAFDWRRRSYPPSTAVLKLRRNPFFHHELKRRPVRSWRWLPLAASALFTVLLLGAWHFSSGPQADTVQMSAGFHAPPWLLCGGVLLLVYSHLLVPLLVTGVLTREGDLPTLTLLVESDVVEEEAMRGQLAAAVGPSLLGVAPMLLTLPPLLTMSTDAGLVAAGGVLGAVTWCTLTAATSAWATARFLDPRRALAWSFGLTTLPIPLGVATLALAVAHGCSAGHLKPQPVFITTAMLTAALLVVGIAATFWDLATRHLFPQRRRTLWQDPAPGAEVRLET